MTIQLSFVPAQNKDGESLGTFVGLSVKEGVSEIKDAQGKVVTDVETGEIKSREWKIVSLQFNVKGRVKGTEKLLEVTTNGLFGDDTKLSLALTGMGFETSLMTTQLDEDGLEITDILRAGDVDEDGLEIVDDVDIESEIEKFVKSVKGQQFWFKVYSEKNFLKINAESIRPKN